MTMLVHDAGVGVKIVAGIPFEVRGGVGNTRSLDFALDDKM